MNLHYCHDYHRMSSSLSSSSLLLLVVVLVVLVVLVVVLLLLLLTVSLRSHAQVFWTALEDDLPADVIQRFAGGKVMAIIGYEVDQVTRQKDPQTGELVDVSLPISMTYNRKCLFVVFAVPVGFGVLVLLLAEIS